MKVAFPSALKAQERIVAEIDQASRAAKQLEDTYRCKLAALGALKQSILKKAFAGELTSPPSQTIKEAAE